MTYDMLHLTCDMCYMTCDMWSSVVGENSLKVSASQLLLFVTYDILIIWRKRLTDWVTESINNKAVCRTAPATPGLLIMPMYSKALKIIQWYANFSKSMKSIRKCLQVCTSIINYKVPKKSREFFSSVCNDFCKIYGLNYISNHSI